MDKTKIKIPPCLYIKEHWCWQRETSDPRVFGGKVEVWDIRTDKCAACMVARMNYGNNALHKPLTKEEKARALC